MKRLSLRFTKQHRRRKITTKHTHSWMLWKMKEKVKKIRSFLSLSIQTAHRWQSITTISLRTISQLVLLLRTIIRFCGTTLHSVNCTILLLMLYRNRAWTEASWSSAMFLTRNRKLQSQNLLTQQSTLLFRLENVAWPNRIWILGFHYMKKMMQKSSTSWLWVRFGTEAFPWRKSSRKPKDTLSRQSRHWTL